MEYTPFPNTATGYLIVEAKTAEGALPVPGAVVTVENVAGAENIKLSLETDVSGKTERLALPTVSSDLSQSYGNIRPFAIYDIYVSAEGFYPFRAKNVPIFSGITTLQPAGMIGLSAQDSESVFPEGNTSVDDSKDTIGYTNE